MSKTEDGIEAADTPSGATCVQFAATCGEPDVAMEVAHDHDRR